MLRTVFSGLEEQIERSFMEIKDNPSALHCCRPIRLYAILRILYASKCNFGVFYVHQRDILNILCYNMDAIIRCIYCFLFLIKLLLYKSGGSL